MKKKEVVEIDVMTEEMIEEMTEEMIEEMTEEMIEEMIEEVGEEVLQENQEGQETIQKRMRTTKALNKRNLKHMPKKLKKNNKKLS